MNSFQKDIPNVPPLCPLCGIRLEKRGTPYSVDDLFSLWESMEFSQKTLADHKSQAKCTQLFECDKCRMGIYFPQIIGTASFYSELSEKSPYYESDKWEFHMAVSDIRKNSSVLEIGCGPGVFLQMATEKTKDVFGVDTNPEAVALAIAKGLSVEDNLEVLVSCEGKYDFVVAFHVLEHVPDPVGFFRLLERIAKPGGRIGVSVPNQDGPIQFIEPCIMNMPPHHATRWRKRTFIELAKKYDLKIIKIATEPLLLQNHTYYSHHWILSRFSQGSRLKRKLGSIISIALRYFFSTLQKTGMKYFPLLPGQSLYVLLEKIQ